MVLTLKGKIQCILLRYIYVSLTFQTIQNLNEYKLPGTEQIRIDFFQVSGKMLLTNIHKFLNVVSVRK
jgi:hypothetical protein